MEHEIQISIHFETKEAIDEIKQALIKDVLEKRTTKSMEHVSDLDFDDADVEFTHIAFNYREV